MFKFGLILGCLAIATTLLISCSQQRRRGALEQAGLALGLRYVGEANEEEGAGWRALPSIHARQRNFFTHVMRGDDAAVFDWTWRDGVLKERKRERQTVAAFRHGGMTFPDFVWTKRGALRRSFTPTMGDPIGFPDEPGFSDRYDVAGPDREALRALFDAGRRSRLVLPDGIQVEASGEWVIGFSPDRSLEASELAEMFEGVRAVSEVLSN